MIPPERGRPAEPAGPDAPAREGLGAEAAVLARLYAGLDQWIAAAPGALGDLAQSFAAEIGLAKHEYFTYRDAPPLVQMPIWAGPDLADDVLDAIVLAAALAYGAVRIQDNLMDEPGARGSPAHLLLGNLMLWDALHRLQDLSLGPAFWDRARGAWEAANAAAADELVWLRRRGPYPQAAYESHARKVALAEVPLLAVLAVQGRMDAHADDVTRLVHALGKAYGVFNDVTGYRRDLACGGQTWLIAELRERIGAAAREGSDDARAIEALIVAEPVLEAFLSRAAAYHEEAREPARRLGLTPLLDRLDARDRRIGELSGEISMMRFAAALSRQEKCG